VDSNGVLGGKTASEWTKKEGIKWHMISPWLRIGTKIIISVSPSLFSISLFASYCPCICFSIARLLLTTAWNFYFLCHWTENYNFMKSYQRVFKCEHKLERYWKAKNVRDLDQGWAKYGPRVIFGPPRSFVRPAEKIF